MLHAGACMASAKLQQGVQAKRHPTPAQLLQPVCRAAGAAWAPDSSVLLLSSTGSNFLVGLHIVGQPTKLIEQLLPVALPGVSDRDL
jgi:hypothetical protein